MKMAPELYWLGIVSDVSNSVPKCTITRDLVGWWVDSMKAVTVGIHQLNFTGSA